MKQKEIEYVMNGIYKFISEKDQKAVEELIEKVIETAQDDGFMKGYEYAIMLLQESMIKKNL